ncbi:MAG: hypothetical protein JWM21_1864 [Acidobacteria bacterium]|nr:hypothetical protein [Acidobacteriota bacterium]
MLLALKRLGIVILIAVVFLFGLATTVYLSLRSPEVKVPEVVGKDRFVAENDLKTAGLNFRVRATRPSRQIKSDTVMFQLPRAGEVVKAGQTVAVDVSRTPKEGEASETVAVQDNANSATGNDKHNANDSAAPANANENKPKRNKNANANANTNANRNSNGNANSNRAKANANANANAKGNLNANNANSNSAVPNTNNHKPQTENGNSAKPNRNANRATPAPTPPGRR